MDELGSIWNTRESVEELRQKLLRTSLDLEMARTEAAEEAKNHKESTRHLLCLLRTAYRERDEFRDQLQKLLNNLVVPSSDAVELSSMSPVYVPQVNVENPILIPGKANSGMTESSSLSLSHGSSTVSSFLEGVSSPELSNMNNVVVDSGGGVGNGCFTSSVLDMDSSIIDDLARGKSLPQKGNLLQAVTEAGPLLQTLLVAGPLPRWRNPPPLQPFRIPSITSIGQKPQMCSAALLNFGTGTNPSQGWLAPLGSGQIPIAKHQRQY